MSSSGQAATHKDTIHMQRNSMYSDIKLQVTMNERMLIEQAFGSHRGLSRRAAEALVELATQMIESGQTITQSPKSLEEILKSKK